MGLWILRIMDTDTHEFKKTGWRIHFLDQVYKNSTCKCLFREKKTRSFTP